MYICCNIRLSCIDQPSDVSTVCIILICMIWQSAALCAGNHKFFNHSDWRFKNYSIRVCMAFTKNRTDSWSKPSLYIFTSIVIMGSLCLGVYEKWVYSACALCVWLSSVQCRVANSGLHLKDKLVWSNLVVYITEFIHLCALGWTQSL